MRAASNLVAALLALSPLAAAQDQSTRTFFNDGNLSGWDFVRHENKGTVAADSQTSFKGGTSLKMTQTFTPGYSGRYHSEVDHNQGYKRGDKRFYGFRFPPR